MSWRPFPTTGIALIDTSPYTAYPFGGAKRAGGIGLQQAQGLQVPASLLFIR
ncbi:MAG TPA: hypothetical protein PLA12_11085 [Candidatus Hydrogenedens sp.]|nr:hypothetical protein [Candidatus Hydrogenedens sp.]